MPSRPSDGLGALDRRRTVSGILACSLFWLVPRTVRAADPKRFSVKIEGGRVPENDYTLRVNEGDNVEIEFASDRTLTLHLHGIDIEITVTPGKPEVMRFAATVAGRFPVEAHGKGAHTALVYVEVYPR
jgi:hypothetical protein